MKNKIIACLLSATTGVGASLMVAGCGSGETAGPLIDNLLVDFSGINSVEKQAGGGWLISWSAIAAGDSVYGIFRGDDEESINFEEPYFTTSQGSHLYMPENSLSEPRRCFAVRVMGGTDENKKVLCNTASPVSFLGLKSLDFQSNGSYLLRWDKLPVDDAVYWIFDRDSSGHYNFDTPSFQATTDFYNTSVLPRGSSKCYMVRAVHPQFKKDENQIELCTKFEEKVLLTGSVTVSLSENNSPRSRVASWTPSGALDVEGYRVYRDNSCQVIAVCSNSIGASGVVRDSECLLNDLQDGTYTMCVVAVDVAGRESESYIKSAPFKIGE